MFPGPPHLAGGDFLPPLRHRKAHRGEAQNELAVPGSPLRLPGPRDYISIEVERIGVSFVLFPYSGGAVWPHLDPYRQGRIERAHTRPGHPMSPLPEQRNFTLKDLVSGCQSIVPGNPAF